MPDENQVSTTAPYGARVTWQPATPRFAMHPDNPRLQRLHDGDRLVVSEPFSDLPGAWHEVPAPTALVVDRDGEHMLRPFQPV